jgi:nicotinamide-nucleotide amidase
MAEGLINTGNCDLSISTTGIAGPKSDNTNKPVGLNYIAIGTKDGVNVYKFNTAGDRKTVTETAINHALFLAYKSIK